MFHLNNKKIKTNIYFILVIFSFLLFFNNSVFAVRKSITTYGLYQRPSFIIDSISLERSSNFVDEGETLLVSLQADLTEELGIRSFEEFKQKCSFFYLNTFSMRSEIINYQGQVIDTMIVRTPTINVVNLEEDYPNEEILTQHIYPKTTNIEEINNPGSKLTITSDVTIINEESPPHNLILKFEIFADGYTDINKKFSINVNIIPDVMFILEILE
nr:hypothetical protein [Candidatus Phytoplasma sacchari]KAB8121785.1 hypothetical protein F2B49_02115 [Candidatus Phytoplasma sacchari]